MEELWQRVFEKRVTALLGTLGPEPPPSLNLRVVRISCDGPHATLGPLLDAAHKVEELLGGPVPLFDQARKRVVLGLRRRLLGDVPGGGPDSLMVETLNRLDIDSDRPSVVVFDAVDAADDATLDTLRRMVSRPGWLRVPVILTFRTKDLAGRPAALLRALKESHGEECILVAESVRSAPAPESIEFNWQAMPADLLRIMRAGALIGSGFEADLVAALLRLDAMDVLEQLQRAADLGAPLSDRGEGRFYLSDASVEKLRAGILPSVARAWHKRLGQILSDASAASVPEWATPVAPPEEKSPAISSPEPEAPLAAEGVEGQTTREPSREEPPTVANAVAGSEDTAEVSAAPAMAESESDERPQWPYSQIFGRPGESAEAPAAMEGAPKAEDKGGPAAGQALEQGEQAIAGDEIETPSGGSQGDRQTLLSASGAETTRMPFGGAPDNAQGYWVNPFVMEPDSGVISARAVRNIPVPAPAKKQAPERERIAPVDMDVEMPAERAPAPRADGGRAAQHLSAAGELEAAVVHYLKASQDAAEAGAYDHALSYSRKALSVLDGLPASPKRRLLRLRVLLELGRLQWNVAGPDASFTLSGALEMLTAAEMLLNASDPAPLWAEVMQLLAGILYDIGDMASLARALDALTKASRVLLEAGDALGAARLLNDQAAVYVRMGDPVRAAHLLSESRKIFEEKAASDPEAMRELAETDHLFARIPLHVQARPGRESDALLMGLDHAIAAERTYKKLSMQRELGRVWETMGRLEIRRKRFERAAARLSAAIGLQDSIGDVIGLARSTAAMSEVLCAHGQFQQAAALLGDSVALNLEKGSPIGLAFNRRALELLMGKAPAGEEVAQAFRSVELRLKEAEGILGKLSLPGERE